MITKRTVKPRKFRKGTRVKFVSKTDGNIKYGLIGKVLEITTYQGSTDVSVQFPDRVWLVCDYELRRAK